MDIYQIRRTNLQAIVDTQFRGRPAALADKMGKTPSEVTRHIPRKKGEPKNIGSSLARQFEAAAGKPEGWLDRLHSSEVREENAYYNTLTNEEMQDVAEEKAFEFVDVWEKKTGDSLPPKQKREMVRLIRDAYLQRLMAGRTIPRNQTEMEDDVDQHHKIVQLTAGGK